MIARTWHHIRRRIRAELMRTHIAQLRMAAGLVVPTDALSATVQAALWARASQVRLALYRLEHPGAVP